MAENRVSKISKLSYQLSVRYHSFKIESHESYLECPEKLQKGINCISQQRFSVYSISQPILCTIPTPISSFCFGFHVPITQIPFSQGKNSSILISILSLQATQLSIIINFLCGRDRWVMQGAPLTKRRPKACSSISVQ